MTTTLDVFISSKMVELKAERDALYDFIPSLDYGDIKLHAWVFEKDVPASNQSIQDEYLAPLRNAELYIGLLWNQYGEWTIDEYDRATDWGKERHIYVKDVDADQREQPLKDFLNQNKVETGITHKWFAGKTQEEQIADLCEKVKQSLNRWVAEYRSGPSGESSARLYKNPAAIIERPETLIGRDNDLAQIKTFLGQNERILIQGFGGTGKTALAAEAAAQFINDNPVHILWLRIGRNDADSLFEALASVFEARTEMAKQAGDSNKSHLLRSLLAVSDIRLVILDDAWNGQALQPLINAVPPNMPLLVTSRRRYDLRQSVSIGDLTPDAGLQLLSYHANVNYSSDKQARDLCAALSNLPFALRIAGISLKMRKQSPAELLSQIENVPHDLALPLDSGEKGRENVAKLLQISLNALDKESRAVFLAFGAFFAPQLTAEMITLFMEQPRTQWIDGDGQKIPIKVISLESTKFDVKPYRKLLNILHVHGLIDHVPTAVNSLEHYRMHDLAYTYARGQAAWEERFYSINACLIYTRIYGEVKLENFKAIYPELNNLIGAARQALEMGMYGEVEEFINSLYIGQDGNGGILIMQGYPQHSIEILEYGVEAAIHRGDHSNQSSHLGNLAIAYIDLGEFNKAIDYAEKSLVIQRKLGDKEKIGNQLTTLGIISEKQGKYYDFLDYHNQALQIYKEAKSKLGIANQLGNIGNTHYRLGHFESAKTYYAQSLELHQELSNKKGESHQLEGLGLVSAAQKNFELSIDYFNSALEISRETGDKRSECGSLNNLGEIYRELGKFEEAIKNLETALLIARSIEDRYLESRVLGNLGNNYCNLGIYDIADKYLSASLKLKRKLGDREGEANAINSFGALHTEQGNYSDALKCFKEALSMYLAINATHLAERAQHNIDVVQKRLTAS